MEESTDAKRQRETKTSLLKVKFNMLNVLRALENYLKDLRSSVQCTCPLVIVRPFFWLPGLSVEDMLHRVNYISGREFFICPLRDY